MGARIGLGSNNPDLMLVSRATEDILLLPAMLTAKASCLDLGVNEF